MSTTLTITDETPSGQPTNTFVLDLLNERITVRELIRERVYEEVRQYNTQLSGTFHGLVQPSDAEATLNGYNMRHRRPINWEKQAAKAVEAFERNGFFILVDDRQAESLDDTIQLTPTTAVSFVKLVPLVGG